MSYQHSHLAPQITDSDKQRLTDRLTHCQRVLLAMLAAGGALLPAAIAWAGANSPIPGTVIRNQATGSFVNPVDSSTRSIESNEVRVTVSEVAGITVTSRGFSEPIDSIVNAGDTVYFDFAIANVGNDPTQFFIPGAATISGGTANGNIQIIEYDPDGTGTSVTNLRGSNITVPPGGRATGNLTGIPNGGSIPSGASLTVRVPVKAGTAGSNLTVILGNTAAANGQNEAYVAGTNDVYTKDNPDANEVASGAPINGEREASNSLTVVIAASSSTISGTLYEDTDGGDRFDSGEPTLPNGIKVILYQDSSSGGIAGAYDVGIDTLVGTTNTTGGNGGYSFTKVPDGTYNIYVNTSDTNIPSNLSLGTPNNLVVTLAGSNQANFNFGFDPSPPLAPANACEILINNSGFELPDITKTPPTPAQTFGGDIKTYNQSDVPGWSTTASDNRIEIWRNGAQGFSSFSGNQFAEVNANGVGALYQNVATTPGTLLTWQFAHRGRGGTDTLRLKIGAPGATVTQTTKSTGSASWSLYQGTYLVPAGQTLTRFEFEAVSTGSGDNTVGNFIDAIRFGPLCDHGDAGASYPVTRANGGAAHTYDGITFLGSSVFVDIDGQPSINANGDDNIPGDDDATDDEDGVTFTSPLKAGASATVNVVASVAGPLSAWIDFNNDNDWNDPGEQIFTDKALTAGTNSLSFSIPSTATANTTYARFRFSPQSGLLPTGIVGGGEVEDYQVAIASNPNVLLVKRITAVNRGLANEQLFDTSYINVGTANDNDNNINWPGGTAAARNGGTVESYIKGITGTDDITPVAGTQVSSGDKIEYTIPFLSAGNATAQDVLICDRIPLNTQFVSDAYNSLAPANAGGGNSGILLNFNGQQFGLTNINDGDEIANTGGNDNGIGGYYFPAGVNPSTAFPGVTVSCGGTNDNGAIVVDLSDIPNATGDGTPSNSYGFIRFRATVD